MLVEWEDPGTVNNGLKVELVEKSKVWDLCMFSVHTNDSSLGGEKKGEYSCYPDGVMGFL